MNPTKPERVTGSGADKDGYIEALLSTGNEQAAVYARLFASFDIQSMTDWINAEVARGTAPARVAMAITNMAANIVASIAAHTCDLTMPDAKKEIAEGTIETFARQISGSLDSIGNEVSNHG